MSILARHKAARTAAKQAAIAKLVTELGRAAPGLGGRYLLFGSAARGDLRYDSDVDLLLDFPTAELTGAAWQVAEQACAQLDLECDLTIVKACSKAFLDHVLPEAKSIP